MKEPTMRKSAALTAFAVAVALGAPTGVSGQQPAPSTQPVASAQPLAGTLQPAPVIDATNQGTVYGWVDGFGRIIPYQTYTLSYQPVYTVRYYYPTPCNTVYYTRPSCCYYRSAYCYRPTYYYSSCRTSRRWFRCCR
jgi:hypothetical protein